MKGYAMTSPAKAPSQQDIDLYDEFKSIARIDEDLRRRTHTPPGMNNTSQEERSPFVPANRN